MVRTLLKPTIFDKKATINRKANKAFASKTKNNIDHFLQESVLVDDASHKIKIDITTDDFKTKEEIEEAKDKKGYKFGIAIEEITNG